MSGNAADDDPIHLFCQVVADDLEMLAVLHDREADAALLQTLKAERFPSGLGLRLESEAGREASAALSALLERMPSELDEEFLDELASDFADIYLNNTLSASPLESVWIDEEGLICQEPMFQVRAWYKRFDLAVPDWRKRPDDHLVAQLQFISKVVRKAGADSLSEMATFMDEHLLRWLPEFAERVSTRCATAYYSALVYLTSAYVAEMREMIAEITGEPVPTKEEIDERMKPKVDPVEVPVAYMPGMEPSW